jgi:signal transduction histidine kinase
MFRNFAQYFSSTDDEDPAFIQLTRNILVFTFIGNILALVVFGDLLIKDSQYAIFTIILSVMVVFEGISLFFAYRNKIGMAKIIVSLSFTGGITFSAISSHGLHSVAILGYGFIVIIGALLFERAARFTVTPLAIIAVEIVAIADMTGITQSPLAKGTDIGDAFIAGLLVYISSAVLQLLIRRLHQNISRAQENERLQIDSNQKLLNLQASLELRVEERTHELQQANEIIQAEHEELLRTEKMASLGRLTGGIAHEINTPLAASRAALVEIRQLTNEYQNSLDDPQVTLNDHHQIGQELLRSLKLAEGGLEHIAGFVRGIKSQIRDEAPRERVRFNAVPVVQDSLLLINHSLRANHCTATFEPQAENIELYGLPGQLSQIVTNLVTNAIDASAERGGGQINIRLIPQDQAVDLLVSDQGVGISPENLPRIFDLLFTTKASGHGTGLGLTIVRDIMAEVFNGTIEVSSQLQQGTTFTLHFPYQGGNFDGA